jgi:hypothetical protein
MLQFYEWRQLGEEFELLQSVIRAYWPNFAAIARQIGAEGIPAEEYRNDLLVRLHALATLPKVAVQAKAQTYVQRGSPARPGSYVREAAARWLR